MSRQGNQSSGGVTLESLHAILVEVKSDVSEIKVGQEKDRDAIHAIDNKLSASCAKNDVKFETIDISISDLKKRSDKIDSANALLTLIGSGLAMVIGWVVNGK